MPLADYAHWNEDAEYHWWHEEGKHPYEPPEPDPDDYNAADAFADELADHTDEQLQALLADTEYLSRYPLAKRLIETEIDYRRHNSDTSETPSD